MNMEKHLQPETVIFIPRTPGGGLIKALTAAENELQKVCTTQVKLIEEA